MDPKILQEFNNQALVDKSRGYGKEADIWSLGCICYELFRGKYPFEAETFDELVSKIQKGKYRLPPTTSSELVSFLDKMLRYDGKARLSARELINEPFIKKNVKDFTNISIHKNQNQINNIKEKNNKESAKDIVNKNYKKINTAPGKPINEEDSLNSNKNNNMNTINLNRNKTYTLPLNFYGIPMKINNQPHIENGFNNMPPNNYPGASPFISYQNQNFINPGINYNIGLTNNK